ncbi:hypothetical protein GGQ73_003210 [Rhizobium skierniewicense]|uniref:Uncharacterized protein n=1 Tax=Rhizobium skierniewicense TaxID=984260 RepID=A0A7W6CA21_9HYPH|nr:hypothetical protein [Rhizobium skierniewicense]MBB3947244.1 hypothetical protein [Rhizobium skierniewicense]
MTGIYFDDARLKSFSASSKGGKSSIKIEIETSDHFELAHMLRQLDAIDAEQKEARKPRKSPVATKTSSPQLALPAPLKQIEFHGGDHEQ